MIERKHVIWIAALVVIAIIAVVFANVELATPGPN